MIEHGTSRIRSRSQPLHQDVFFATVVFLPHVRLFKRCLHAFSRNGLKNPLKLGTAWVQPQKTWRGRCAGLYRVVYWLSLLRIFQVLNSTQLSMHLGNHAPVGRRPDCFQTQQLLTGNKPNYSAKMERGGAGGFSTRMFMRFHFIRKQHQIVLRNNAKSEAKHPKLSDQNMYLVI